MFQFIKLIVAINLLITSVIVSSNPLYKQPNNQYLTAIPPSYNNLLSASITPYGYVQQPIYTYDPLVYNQQAYANQLNNCCTENYGTPLYKTLLEYYVKHTVKQYLQSGNPQPLLNLYKQPLPPLKLQVSKMIVPCPNYLPEDFVGTIANKNSKIERTRGQSREEAKFSKSKTTERRILGSLAPTKTIRNTQKLSQKGDNIEEIIKNMDHEDKVISYKLDVNETNNRNMQSKQEEMNGTESAVVEKLISNDDIDKLYNEYEDYLKKMENKNNINAKKDSNKANRLTSNKTDIKKDNKIS